MVLIINDKKISKISGPVGYTLLKPKKKVFNDLLKEGVRLPLIFFFWRYSFFN